MAKAPKHFHTLKQKFPAYLEALESLGAVVRTIGPLDSKTCELIQLGSAATNRSEGAVHSHARRALEAGASRDEIEHALLCLTSTIGFPAVSAALSWIEDID